MFALVVTPIVVERMGWPWAFYLFGLLGFVWAVPWFLKVTASPADDPCSARSSSPKSGQRRRAPTEPPPLRALLSKPAVWAVIVAHFCNNWSLYVLLAWLPTFVNQGLGVAFASVGLFTIIPNIAGFSS